MKYISEKYLPDSFHYQIHSHNGLNGPEHEAHVHIYSKKHSVEVKYSLNTGCKIEGEYGRRITKDDIKAIENWVSDNLRDLNDEWDRADDPNGGRN